MARRPCPSLFDRRLDGARLRLPQGLVDVVGSDAALSADATGCVRIVEMALWRETLPGLQECTDRNHHAAELFRFLVAGETGTPMDSRGRVTIPRLHMEWAGLAPNANVIVISLGREIDVWDPLRLEEFLRRANTQLRGLHSSVFREQLSLMGE